MSKLTFPGYRRFTYTGLTFWESFDLQEWIKVFHEDDLPLAVACWEHSMATGDPFDVRPPSSPRPCPRTSSRPQTSQS